MAKSTKTSVSSYISVTTKNEIQVTEKLSLNHHTNEVWDVCFSHDGTRLASSGADQTTRIYSTETFEVLHVLRGHSAGICRASWSPDDSKIVTCGLDHKALLWDTLHGKNPQELTGFGGPVTDCVWLLNGSEFITTADHWSGRFNDKSMGLHIPSLCIWSIDGFLIHAFPLETSLLGCIVLPDARIASFDQLRTVYIHDLSSRQLISTNTLDTALSSMCTGRSGKPCALLMSNDGLIELIDSRTMETVKVFKMRNKGRFVMKATFGGEDEVFVASGNEDGELNIWDTRTGERLLKEKIHDSSCNTIAWNPRKLGMIATAGDDNTVRILTISEDDEKWEHVDAKDLAEA